MSCVLSRNMNIASEMTVAEAVRFYKSMTPHQGPNHVRCVEVSGALFLPLRKQLDIPPPNPSAQDEPVHRVFFICGHKLLPSTMLFAEICGFATDANLPTAARSTAPSTDGEVLYSDGPGPRCQPSSVRSFLA